MRADVQTLLVISDKLKEIASKPSSSSGLGGQRQLVTNACLLLEGIALAAQVAIIIHHHLPELARIDLAAF